MPPHGVILSCPPKETPVGSTTLRLRSLSYHTSLTTGKSELARAIGEAKPRPSTELLGLTATRGRRIEMGPKTEQLRRIVECHGPCPAFSTG